MSALICEVEGMNGQARADMTQLHKVRRVGDSDAGRTRQSLRELERTLTAQDVPALLVSLLDASLGAPPAWARRSRLTYLFKKNRFFGLGISRLQNS